jgi:hypothetical protein
MFFLSLSGYDSWAHFYGFAFTNPHAVIARRAYVSIRKPRVGFPDELKKRIGLRSRCSSKPRRLGPTSVTAFDFPITREKGTAGFFAATSGFSTFVAEGVFRPEKQGSACVLVFERRSCA